MKPILQKISPFDASYPHTFTIIWSGTIPNANELIISEADTGTQVEGYDKKIESHSLIREIPAKTLENGKQYVVQCYVYDSDDIKSEISDKIQFRTFTTPTLSSNIENNSVINSSSVLMKINYFQPEGEQLSLYKFSIYNSNNSLLYETDDLYDTDNISYSFNGLDNNEHYYLECTGSTINGMSVSTGKIHVLVKYKELSDYSRFLVECDRANGWNKWYTNITIISYRGEETFTYINKDEEPEYVDLSNKSLIYGNDGSFTIPNDATIVINGKGLYKTDTIFECYDSETFNHINVNSIVYDDGTLRFKLISENGLNNYIIYSEPLVFGNNQDVSIEIIKKSNLYSINAYIK